MSKMRRSNLFYNVMYVYLMIYHVYLLLVMSCDLFFFKSEPFYLSHAGAGGSWLTLGPGGGSGTEYITVIQYLSTPRRRHHYWICSIIPFLSHPPAPALINSPRPQRDSDRTVHLKKSRQIKSLRLIIIRIMIKLYKSIVVI